MFIVEVLVRMTFRCNASSSKLSRSSVDEFALPQAIGLVELHLQARERSKEDQVNSVTNCNGRSYVGIIEHLRSLSFI